MGGANFKETQLHRMRAGMKVRLVPDIDPDDAVDGVVDSLAPATGALFSLLPPENATGNFTKVVQRVPVKLRLDPGDDVRDDCIEPDGVGPAAAHDDEERSRTLQSDAQPWRRRWSCDDQHHDHDPHGRARRIVAGAGYLSLAAGDGDAG